MQRWRKNLLARVLHIWSGSRISFWGWKNKAMLLNALKSQLWFNVLEFLVLLRVTVRHHGFITTYRCCFWSNDTAATKQQKEAAVVHQGWIKQAFVSLPVCLHAVPLFSHQYGSVRVTPVCVPLTDQSPACLRARPCLPTCLYLLVCLRATWPAPCPWSFSERDWLVGRPLRWLVTYHRAEC